MNATVELPCSNLPPHRTMVLALSAGNFGVAIPTKRCVSCGLVLDPLQFLKWDGTRQFKGVLYGCLNGAAKVCNHCAPSEPVVIVFDKLRHARLKIVIVRDEAETPFRWRDAKDDKLRAFVNAGVRRMTPGGNVFRIQPRRDRQRDAAGRAYGRPNG